MIKVTGFPGGVVLGSGSDPRAHILKLMDIEFEQTSTNVPEDLPKSAFAAPKEYCDATCLQKAHALLGMHSPLSRKLGICADTIVILDNLTLEKPSSRGEAQQMLMSYSGKTVEVYTSTVLLSLSCSDPRILTQYGASTFLGMREYSSEEINRYLDKYYEQCKSGSGALKVLSSSCLLVKSIRGCFYNAAGLSPSLLLEALSGMQGGEANKCLPSAGE